MRTGISKLIKSLIVIFVIVAFSLGTTVSASASDTSIGSMKEFGGRWIWDKDGDPEMTPRIAWGPGMWNPRTNNFTNIKRTARVIRASWDWNSSFGQNPKFIIQPLRTYTDSDYVPKKPNSCPERGDVVITFRDPKRFDIDPKEGAETIWCYKSKDRIYSATIVINSRFNWYYGTGRPKKNQYDFYSAITHELGHVLGLGHFDKGNSGCKNKKIRYTMCGGMEKGTIMQRHPAYHEIGILNRHYGYW